MILDDEQNCGMLMMLLLMKRCWSCIIGLINFVYVVLALAIILILILNLQVVTGHGFLGGFIGSCSERDEYVMFKSLKVAVTY